MSEPFGPRMVDRALVESMLAGMDVTRLLHFAREYALTLSRWMDMLLIQPELRTVDTLDSLVMKSETLAITLEVLRRVLEEEDELRREA